MATTDDYATSPPLGGVDMSTELVQAAAAEAVAAAAQAAQAAQAATEAEAEGDGGHVEYKGEMELGHGQDTDPDQGLAHAVEHGDHQHLDTHAHSHDHSHTQSHPQSHAHTHSQSHTHTHTPTPDLLPQPGHGPPPPPAYQRARTGLPASFLQPHSPAPHSPLSNAEQLNVMREFYARNPNPGKKDLEMLAERTGRPWNKIREYFRQRRNKLRGLTELENMEEPGRASGWLQVAYRPGPSSASVSQLALYNAYKTRFDPYAVSSPLLGGQDLIQLACATFPGCEMARDEGDYVVRGLRDRDGGNEEWEKGVDALVEPLRGTTWLLSNFQHQDPSLPATLAQTELYSAYAARFSNLLDQAEDDAREAAEAAASAEGAEGADASVGGVPGVEGVSVEGVPGVEGVGSVDVPGVDVQGVDTVPVEPFSEMDDINEFLPEPGPSGAFDSPSPTPPPNRLLNPVELITLTRMTFPQCEPAVDEAGRFVIRGLERREGVEKGRPRHGDMFPFALAAQPAPSDPAHPFTSLLKRKLATLNPEPDKRARTSGIGVNIPPSVDEELGDDERELLEGIKRWRESRLGREVRDVCVQQ